MSNTFKFSSRSEKNLQGVNPDLVKVTRRALEISGSGFWYHRRIAQSLSSEAARDHRQEPDHEQSPSHRACRGCCGLCRQPGVMGMAAVRKNRSSIQTGQPGTEYSGGMGRRLEDPERRTAFSVTTRSLSGMKLWPTLGVAFLLITSMRLSWSLGRENARNEAQASTLKSTVDTLNIISAGYRICSRCWLSSARKISNAIRTER
ncbi:putative phage PS3 [Escherichia coli]|nr:putative phage PS3 [Escherichia coli]